MFKNEKLLIFINGKSISEIFLQAYFLLCIMLGGVFLATKLAWKMIGHCFNGNFFSTFCVHMLWLSIFCQSLSSFFLLKKYWHSQMSVGETKRIQYLTLQSEREWEKLQTLSTFLSGSKAFDLISYFYKVLHLWILKQLPTYKATHYSECFFLLQ